ncbi:oligogalacturonate-specific porin KdgM family protein [Vibrio methylphosphonaticus]|uniref:oligogalacturonate-specific porin KdgM family protein n=1 Tax=Vibrio methylphosphonaticus TaxID=2946866 RepID=UPI002029C74E|nr:oligogalacturonate-specific porin KdgM family protein [Vibrio methylphosphonaticus]MCL9773236.1 oligogalacturonate-specific porin KdgM family protein [Vibrio methylphosphonaticus]
MKKVLALTALAVASTSAFAGSSYVTGNVQFHDTYLQGSKTTSTLEAGHTFDSNTTLLVEFDAIPLGKVEDGASPLPATTLGVEQMFSVTDNLWLAAGYHHLIQGGETIQYRPLVKIGYNFDNGLSLSNRTRAHINNQQDGQTRNSDTDVRLDNKIAYQFADTPVALSYNNVYLIAGDKDANGADKVNTMDHELRATWTRTGVQPYVEFRSQAHGLEDANGSSRVNNAFVLGASYGF